MEVDKMKSYTGGSKIDDAGASGGVQRHVQGGVLEAAGGRKVSKHDTHLYHIIQAN